MSQIDKKIYIKGMTCVSCETIISNELKQMPGLQSMQISCKSGIAKIKHDHNFDQDQVIDRINKLGYQASWQPNNTNMNVACTVSKAKATPQQWFISLMLVVALYLAYRLLLNLGLFNWLDVNPSNISYGVAFLVGVVASMSTCLMVVGAVVISFSAKYQGQGTSFYQTAMKPQLMFHLGRLATFFILGGLLGLAGSWLKFSDHFIAWFTLIIAIILAWLGLNILGLVPSLSKFGFRLPASLMKIWDKLQTSDNTLAPILLGGLTFFLPCGFTQSMQLFAVATGDFWVGAYTLLLFALGTTPILFGLGLATNKFSNLKSIIFKQAVGLIVILFAVYTLSNGLTLLGWNLNLPALSSANKAIAKSGQQVIEMTVNYSGFEPNNFELEVGVPVKWIIIGEQVTGCTNEIIVPELDIRKKISPGQNIVEFIPEKVGVINFSCWMGMVKGSFVVKDSLTTSSDPEGGLTCPIDPTGQSNCG